MKGLFLALTLAAVIAGDAGRAAAQSDRVQWTGSINQGNVLEVRGISGSIRATASQDGSAHVEALLGDPAIVRMDVFDHAQGVIVCAVYNDSAGDCGQGRGTNRRSNDNNNNKDDARVDFVVRVPAGVRFNGAMVNGSIDVQGLRSDAQAATVNGRVNIETSGFVSNATTVNGDVVLALPAGLNADFTANTVNGRIESDFPMQVAAAPTRPDGRPISRGGGPQSVRATIGSGGSQLRVTTVNGNIRLLQR
jgi:hypothetical protein